MKIKLKEITVREYKESYLVRTRKMIIHWDLEKN